MSKDTCTQVHLMLSQKGMKRYDIAWIPSKFAVKGKILKIKGHTGFWEDGWEVTNVWTTMKVKEVRERSQDHKNLPSLKK